MITKDDVIAYFKEKKATEFDSPVYIVMLNEDGDLERMGGCDRGEMLLMLLKHMRSVQCILKNSKEDFIVSHAAEDNFDFLTLLTMLYNYNMNENPEYFKQEKVKTTMTQIPRWMDNGSRG